MPVTIKIDVEEVRKDIRWLNLSKAELDLAEKVIRDVANSQHPERHPQVMAIRQTCGEWYRIKERHLRTIVEFRGDVMVVKHILRRCENMYEWVEIWWHVEKRAIRK